MPLVSVIVPNYNHAPYLSRRLESVLQQNFNDFEVIILDDASTDASRQVITPYLTDSRVRFFPNDTNSGLPFIQWNRGVDLARGDFIWIAESDDYADPELLAALVPPLIQSPELGISYCQSNHIDESGVNHGSLIGWTDDLDSRRWREGFVNDGRDECARYLIWKNTLLNASAVVFRRSVYRSAGGAPVHLRQCGDWLTWARIMLLSSVRFDPRALNYFRSHRDNVRSSTSAAEYYRQKCFVQNAILSRVSIPRASQREVCFRALQSLNLLTKNSGDKLGPPELLRCFAAAVPLLVRCPLFSLSKTFRYLFERVS